METTNFKTRYQYAQLTGLASLLMFRMSRISIFTALVGAYYFCPEIFSPFALDYNRYKVMQQKRLKEL